ALSRSGRSGWTLGRDRRPAPVDPETVTEQAGQLRRKLGAAAQRRLVFVPRNAAAGQRDAPLRHDLLEIGDNAARDVHPLQLQAFDDAVVDAVVGAEDLLPELAQAEGHAQPHTTPPAPNGIRPLVAQRASERPARHLLDRGPVLASCAGQNAGAETV